MRFRKELNGITAMISYLIYSLLYLYYMVLAPVLISLKPHYSAYYTKAISSGLVP